MENKDKPSEINLFKGALKFTNEPLWYRIVMTLIVIAGILLALYFIKAFIFPIVASNFSGIVSQRLEKIARLIKGSSP